MKLKRKYDDKVFDCTIFEKCISYSFNDYRGQMYVVYYDPIAQWTTEPLENFVPAVQGKDY